jgi:hypothetical protein
MYHREPNHSDQPLSKKTLAHRRRRAARKTAKLTKESPVGRANAQSSQEKARENNHDTKLKMNGDSFAKSGEDTASSAKAPKVVAAEVSQSTAYSAREEPINISATTADVNETQKRRNNSPIKTESFTASPSHSSSGIASKTITPMSSKSWATVCSSPITPSAFVSEPLQANTKLVDSVTPVQQSSISAEVGKVARSDVSPPTITELNDFIHHPTTGRDVAAGLPINKDREEKKKPEDQAQQLVATAMVVTNVLPGSPPEVSASSTVSYAETAQSPSQKTTNSIKSNADAPPQPKVLCESPATGTMVEQPLDNLYLMIRQQRLSLLGGPLITIYIGDIELTGIFKRLAMACCSVLSKHFAKFPESLEYRFAPDSIAPAAVAYLLVKWAKDMSQDFETYAVPMQGSFAKDVALLRASRLLGMEPYTKHMLNTYIHYLKESLPSYQEIEIVELNATSEKDPLWTHMVNHLCHDRHKKLIPDPENFAHFLEEHPRLKEAMEKADFYFASVAKKNWEERKAEWEAYEAERRAHWELNENEKRERITREKDFASSLRKKMDTKGGSGLTMATAEEAAFLRNR